MKHLLPCLLAAGFMMLATTACKEKKQSEDIIVAKYVPQKPQAPISMRPDVRTTQITWQGRPYDVKVERVAADSLPMVSDENGQKYVDNRISLSIVRADCTVFFKKVFTKASFAALLNGDFRQRGVLENIVFHKVDGNELEFAVIVTHPDADDEFFPLELDIDAQGNIDVERGSLLEDERDDLNDDDDD